MAKEKEIKIPQQEEESYDISTAISVACDITLILGYPPIIDDEVHDHLIWAENDEFDAFVCNDAGHLTCRDDLCREVFLALLGVTAFYNYRFNDEGRDQNEIPNPFQNKHTH